MGREDATAGGGMSSARKSIAGRGLERGRTWEAPRARRNFACNREPVTSARIWFGMEPIDERITAAQLMALRSDPHGARKICDLLGVDLMAARLAERTRLDIAEFVVTGDAVLAAQLIHAAIVRTKRGGGAA
jgi:hypothetical protein